MELYLLRHAIAAERSDAEYPNDDERPLTEDGIKKMKAAAKGMGKLDLAFDHIWTSPLVRARQTAEIVAKRLGLAKVLENRDELGNAFSNEALIELLRQAGQDKKILCVGHEPDFSQFGSYLLAGHTDLKISLKKGGLIRLDFEGEIAPGQAMLVWSLEPGQLRLGGNTD